MKIVTLLGSPRTKGSSATIARRLMDTAAELGADTHSYELNRLTFRGCQGCYACKTTLDHCVLNDGLTEVLAAVQDADAVVLASPVYYGDITCQLKGFMDRSFSYLVPDFHNTPQPSRLTPKKIVFVLTQGNEDEAAFADIFPRYEAFLRWQGHTDITLIRACGIGPDRNKELPEEALRQTEEAARALMA